MQLLGSAFVNTDGEGLSVTQFVKRDAGALTVAMNVIVRMGRVIPRMANVLVPGDLLGQNVKSPALKDIMALNVYKFVLDVTQLLMNAIQ